MAKRTFKVWVRRTNAGILTSITPWQVMLADGGDDPAQWEKNGWEAADLTLSPPKKRRK